MKKYRESFLAASLQLNPQPSGACGVFDCGRRARSFSGRAFREQRKLRRPLHHTFQACSFPLEGWRLIDFHCARLFHPAHPLVHRDVPLARARASGHRALREHRRSTGLHPLLCSRSTGPARVAFPSIYPIVPPAPTSHGLCCRSLYSTSPLPSIPIAYQCK